MLAALLRLPLHRFLLKPISAPALSPTSTPFLLSTVLPRCGFSHPKSHHSYCRSLVTRANMSSAPDYGQLPPTSSTLSAPNDESSLPSTSSASTTLSLPHHQDEVTLPPQKNNDPITPHPSDSPNSSAELQGEETRLKALETKQQKTDRDCRKGSDSVAEKKERGSQLDGREQREFLANIGGGIEMGKDKKCDQRTDKKSDKKSDKKIDKGSNKGSDKRSDKRSDKKSERRSDNSTGATSSTIKAESSSSNQSPFSNLSLPRWSPCGNLDPHHSQDSVTIVSYNILAQAYVKKEMFPGSPPSCLRWKPRCAALKELLLSFQADFLCLQEVDEYESTYAPFLADHGYASIYVKRPGNKRDGSAIFYNTKKFRVLHAEAIDYDQLAQTLATKLYAAKDKVSEASSPLGDTNAAGGSRNAEGGTTNAGGSDTNAGGGSTNSGGSSAHAEGGSKSGMSSAVAVVFTPSSKESTQGNGSISSSSSVDGTRGPIQQSPGAADLWPCTTRQQSSSSVGSSNKESQESELADAFTALTLHSTPSDVIGQALPLGVVERDDVVLRYTRNCVGVLGLFQSVSAPETETGNSVCSEPVSETETQLMGLGDEKRSPQPAWIAVCSTHLYWDPAYADVKLTQAQYLLQRVSRFRTCSSRHLCMEEALPVVIGGDFNSLPGSPVYNLMTSSELAKSGLSFQSGYFLGCGKEPEVTTYVRDFNGTIDYIFTDPQCSLVSSVLHLEDVRDLSSKGGGLPNEAYPSDHMPIGVKLNFMK